MDMTRLENALVAVVALVVISESSLAFSPHVSCQDRSAVSPCGLDGLVSSWRLWNAGGGPRTVLKASAGQGGKRRKRKRRKRKQPPGATAPDPVREEKERVEGLEKKDGSDDEIMDDIDDEVVTEKDRLLIEDVAKFEYETDKDSAVAQGVQGEKKTSEGSIPLPDIKDALKKKKMEEELARLEEEKEEKKVKIKRSDKEAFTKLLEQQPFADADDSFFVEEEYNTVSALLGERAKPFLGIPSGPLQVGHFIGALGIVLMAFIEYPGFPLTNLPTPLREALQGGLATVYAINTVLAVLAAFKAGERGQPKLLWVAKTFSVGGLAFDQLMQLPTLEEIEVVKSKKGKRALKNRMA